MTPTKGTKLLKAGSAATFILLLIFACTVIPSGSNINYDRDYSGKFQQVWSDFDLHYSYFTQKGVDWTQVKNQYGVLTLNDLSYPSFINDVCAPMLKTLKDYHVHLIDKNGTDIPLYNRSVKPNYDFSEWFHQKYFSGNIHYSNNQMFTYSSLPDSIGYIRISNWNPVFTEDIDQFHLRLDNYRNYRGMIIDVRSNEGGSETVAQNAAGRFSDEIHVYAWQQYRNGPGHEDFTDLQSRSFAPSGDWQYLKPIVLLIGEESMSANESFILMMSTLPQVTTVGDTTRGASGAPVEYTLDDGTRYFISSWIAYKTDQSVLEDVGIFPDILIPEDESIIKEKDMVLEKAISLFP